MIEKKTVSQCITADYCRGWNDAVDAMPQWISVEERLPEPFVSVLVYMPGESPLPTVHEGYYAENGMWAAAHYARPTDEITHWAEMPEPPKEG